MAKNSGNELTQMLRPLVQLLIDDMRSHLNVTPEEKASWRAQFDAAKKAERVGVAYDDWETEQLTQAAVGWVVATVFIRFIEDNELFGEGRAYLSGYNTPLREAARYFERELYRRHPEQSYRGYIEHCVNQLSTAEATKGLVEEHSAIHIYTPTDDGARAIVEFWRGFNPDEEDPRALNDPDLDTRFLGDLYEHLSEFAQKKYALRQTPEFVEEFILDRTLTPALNDRPLEGFKLIDPTCGSGHFLIGAFRRIFERWRHQEPAGDLRVHVDRAMSSIYGIDINPYAVAITTFRLTVEAHKTGRYSHLKEPRETTFTVLTGDTLFFGPDSMGRIDFDMDLSSTGQRQFAYSTEDKQRLDQVLMSNQYDAVVGNPPYIATPDPAQANVIKRRYEEFLSKGWVLSVPFMVKFFRLAKREDIPGWVGQITSNSFMTRSYGKKIVETFFREIQIREVIDSSIFDIPGHATPTVILVGKPGDLPDIPVRMVVGRSAANESSHKAETSVWRTMAAQIDNPGFQNHFLEISDRAAAELNSFPWQVSAETNARLISLIANQQGRNVKDLLASDVGGAVRTGADEVFIWANSGAAEKFWGDAWKPLVVGNGVRDYQVSSDERILFPYCSLFDSRVTGQLEAGLWPWRKILRARRTFQGTMLDAGKHWTEYMQYSKSIYEDGELVTFAEVSTHPQFALTPRDVIYKQSSPVLRFNPDVSHAVVAHTLGILNSPVFGFWMRERAYMKGPGTEAWGNRYQIAGNLIESFALPATANTTGSERLVQLTSELNCLEPAATFQQQIPTLELIASLKSKYEETLHQIIAEQEELDWAVYKLYGITEEDLSFPAGSVEGIELGQRAFEIALARRVAAGETETAWFERHHSTPITELPGGWPPEYMARVRQRLELIESDRFINLLERPQYKRRWASEPWEEKVSAALRDWLLTRLEDGGMWFDQDGMPQPRSIAEISGVIEARAEYADVLSVLPLWSQKRDATTLQMLEDLLKGESVPYLKALRYKPSGLRKRAEWERAWEQQREEDAGTRDGKDVDVPPNYSKADMYPDVWKHRGKLDVPKDRFIAYPGAGSEEDPTEVIGWAGWDHLQQGLAIYRLFLERKQEEAPVEVQAALLNGLQQELPWIMQWHNNVDPGTGERLGSYLSQHLEEHTHQLGISLEDLEQYNPARRRARRAKGKSKK